MMMKNYAKSESRDTAVLTEAAMKYGQNFVNMEDGSETEDNYY